MKAVILILFSILLASGLFVLVVGRPASLQRAYTLVDVQAGLHNHAGAWIGRTVLVQGEVQQVTVSAPGGRGTVALASVNALYPPPWADVRFLLIPPTQGIPPPLSYTAPHLWLQPHLAVRRADPLTSWLRRLPVLGRLFVPAPQWAAARVFRLTLLRSQGPGCGTTVCPDAWLDDIPS